MIFCVKFAPFWKAVVKYVFVGFMLFNKIIQKTATMKMVLKESNSPHALNYSTRQTREHMGFIAEIAGRFISCLSISLKYKAIDGLDAGKLS